VRDTLVATTTTATRFCALCVACTPDILAAVKFSVWKVLQVKKLFLQFKLTVFPVMYMLRLKIQYIPHQSLCGNPPIGETDTRLYE
jgi:hypothetical protein